MTYLYVGFFSFMTLAALEAVGRQVFWPPAYRLGLRVLREHIPSSIHRVALTGYSTVTETTNAKFKVVGGAVLIRRRQLFFVSRTTFDLVGRLSCTDNGDWTFEVRLPLMTVAFMAIWLTGWSVAVLGQARGTLDGGNWQFAAIGYLVFALVTGFGVTHERQHMRRLLSECLSLIAPEARLTSASS